jgi:GTP cyclohydrolase I
LYTKSKLYLCFLLKENVMLLKEELEFVIKRMNNLVEMDDLIFDSVKEIHMILLNLKIESAHLTERGKRNGISPICDTLDEISKKMKEQANSYKKDREKALELEDKIKQEIDNMEEC